MISVTLYSLYVVNSISHFDDSRGVRRTTICATFKGDRLHLSVGLTFRRIGRIACCYNRRVLTFGRRGLCEVKHVDAIVNNLSIDIMNICVKIQNIQIVLVTYKQIASIGIKDLILNLGSSSRTLFRRTIDIIVLIEHIALIHTD